MTKQRPVDAASKHPRVFGFSLTFFRNRALRRVLNIAGADVRFGWPKAGDDVLVWGRANTAARGQGIAAKTGARVVTAEDGFLRSVKTGRQGDRPMSVILDRQGVYFETGKPSDFEQCLAQAADVSAEQIAEARQAIDFMRVHHLSKYNDFDLTVPALPERFVLVIDQTLNDASIDGAGSNAGTFQTMLETALSENPEATVLVKTHPETLAGQRRGYYDDGDATERVVLFSDPVSPWVLLDRAEKVYCVSSTMGMEAIFAGHRPIVFGRAFYSGLGLSEDRHADGLKRDPLSMEQLFHAAYHSYCTWVDPLLDRETDAISIARVLAAQAGFARTHSKPAVFVGMRLWKRGFLRRFFQSASKAPLFIEDTQKAVAAAVRDGADVFVWSGKETEELARGCAEHSLTLYRVEDGFLRSAGLGANLIEPVSLALDDLGIYYDPMRESQLERMIAANADLPEFGRVRAEAIRAKIVALKLSKYNLQAEDVALPDGRHTVLIPGQVEDDQSILKGASAVRTNLDLVKATRQALPDSYLIYKPHPDVLAGLRDGGSALQDIEGLVDVVLPDADIAPLLDQVDCVSTITSLTGFEALLRGKDVTCFGAPFYAGWGLTKDLGSVPERRQTKVDINGLVHAAFVDYPRYWDPVTGEPCPVETVLTRFEQGAVQSKGRGSVRWLAKAQGLFASYAHLWR